MKTIRFFGRQPLLATALRPATGAALIALAIGASANISAAQDRPQRGAVVGYLAAGVSRMGTGALNDRLATSGYPTFSRAATGVGLGAYLLLQSGVMLGGEWNGLITPEQTHNGYDVGLGGGYGTLGVGYAVTISRRVRVYPRLGLGGGGMGLTVERMGDEVGFDQVLADPDTYARPTTAGDAGAELSMTREGAVVDLGGGAEFLPGGWGRGLFVGVRAGYLVAPFSSDWRIDGRTVSNGPAATIGGLYLRVVVGGGPGW